MGSAALAADPVGERFWASAALVHRSLEEEAASGARLLRESGPMLELRVGAKQVLAGGGALAAELYAAGGALDYDGQTQPPASLPFQTTSRHRDAGARLLWRPVSPQAWGEPWLVLGLHQNRRDIAGMRTVSGLRETSSAALAGVLWKGAPHPVTARWQLGLEVEAMVSLRHRLHVDFEGLYDNARLEGGRQRRTAVRLVGTSASSPWSWAAEWSHLNQAVSPAATLRLGGAVAGSVRQPHLNSDDLTLRVTRRF